MIMHHNIIIHRRFSMLIRKHMHMCNDSMEHVQAKVLARLAETEACDQLISLLLLHVS